MYDRTYLDGEKFDNIINGTIKSTNIMGLSKCLNIKLYMYAFALGYEQHCKEESVHRRDFASNSSIINNYPEAITFMKAVHCAESRAEEKELENLDEAYDLAEKYVNAGLSIIDKEAEKEDEELIVFSMLRKLDKKYSELFE